MLDINQVTLDEQVKEVERQIRKLQFDDPEEFESTKEEAKIPELNDFNVSETASFLNISAIPSSTKQEKLENQNEQQSESTYEKTTNVDTISISNMSQLTNPLMLLSTSQNAGLTAQSLLTKERKQSGGNSSAMNTFTNLFVKNDINQRRTKDHHGIIIDAHRGGQKGVEPDNTLRAFEKAIEMGVQMIELDIWITKDDKLVIMHGGNNGELPEKDIKFLSLAGPGEKAGEPEYIFDYTYAEIREHHKQTNYFLNSSQDEKCMVCEVKDLFELMKSKPNIRNDFQVSDESNLVVNRQTFANLELKCPIDPELKEKYDWQKAARLLHSQIQAYNFAEFCFVQSFDFDSLKYFENINQNFVSEKTAYLDLVKSQKDLKTSLKVETLYIHNYFHYIANPPMDVMTSRQGCGGHLQINHVTPELIDQMHRHGKIVGIWIDAIAPFEEDYAYYEKAYELKVDMVTTDFPEVAHRILMEIHKKHLMEELSNNSVMNI